MFQFLGGLILGHYIGSSNNESDKDRASGISVFAIIVLLWILASFVNSFERDILNGYFYILNFIYGTQHSYDTVFVDNNLLKFKDGMELISALFAIGLVKIASMFFMILVLVLTSMRATIGSIVLFNNQQSMDSPFGKIVLNIFLNILIFFIGIVLIDFLYKSINLY